MEKKSPGGFSSPKIVRRDSRASEALSETPTSGASSLNSSSTSKGKSKTSKPFSRALKAVTSAPRAVTKAFRAVSDSIRGVSKTKGQKGQVPPPALASPPIEKSKSKPYEERGVIQKPPSVQSLVIPEIIIEESPPSKAESDEDISKSKCYLEVPPFHAWTDLSRTDPEDVLPQTSKSSESLNLENTTKIPLVGEDVVDDAVIVHFTSSSSLPECDLNNLNKNLSKEDVNKAEGQNFNTNSLEASNSEPVPVDSQIMNLSAVLTSIAEHEKETGPVSSGLLQAAKDCFESFETGEPPSVFYINSQQEESSEPFAFITEICQDHMRMHSSISSTECLSVDSDAAFYPPAPTSSPDPEYDDPKNYCSEEEYRMWQEASAAFGEPFRNRFPEPKIRKSLQQTQNEVELENSDRENGPLPIPQPRTVFFNVEELNSNEIEEDSNIQIIQTPIPKPRVPLQNISTEETQTPAEHELNSNKIPEISIDSETPKTLIEENSNEIPKKEESKLETKTKGNSKKSALKPRRDSLEKIRKDMEANLLSESQTQIEFDASIPIEFLKFKQALSFQPTPSNSSLKIQTTEKVQSFSALSEEKTEQQTSTKILSTALTEVPLPSVPSQVLNRPVILTALLKNSQTLPESPIPRPLEKQKSQTTVELVLKAKSSVSSTNLPRTPSALKLYMDSKLNPEAPPFVPQNFSERISEVFEAIDSVEEKEAAAHFARPAGGPTGGPAPGRRLQRNTFLESENILRIAQALREEEEFLKHSSVSVDESPAENLELLSSAAIAEDTENEIPDTSIEEIIENKTSIEEEEKFLKASSVSIDETPVENLDLLSSAANAEDIENVNEAPETSIEETIESKTSVEKEIPQETEEKPEEPAAPREKKPKNKNSTKKKPSKAKRKQSRAKKLAEQEQQQGSSSLTENDNLIDVEDFIVFDECPASPDEEEDGDNEIDPLYSLTLKSVPEESESQCALALEPDEINKLLEEFTGDSAVEIVKSAVVIAAAAQDHETSLNSLQDAAAGAVGCTPEIECQNQESHQRRKKKKNKRKRGRQYQNQNQPSSDVIPIDEPELKESHLPSKTVVDSGHVSAVDEPCTKSKESTEKSRVQQNSVSSGAVLLKALQANLPSSTSDNNNDFDIPAIVEILNELPPTKSEIKLAKSNTNIQQGKKSKSKTKASKVEVVQTQRKNSISTLNDLMFKVVDPLEEMNRVDKEAVKSKMFSKKELEVIDAAEAKAKKTKAKAKSSSKSTRDNDCHSDCDCGAPKMLFKQMPGVSVSIGPDGNEYVEYDEQAARVVKVYESLSKSGLPVLIPAELTKSFQPLGPNLPSTSKSKTKTNDEMGQVEMHKKKSLAFFDINCKEHGNPNGNTDAVAEMDGCRKVNHSFFDVNYKDKKKVQQNSVPTTTTPIPTNGLEFHNSNKTYENKLIQERDYRWNNGTNNHGGGNINDSTENISNPDKEKQS